MNYLQYISSVYQSESIDTSKLRFLVSGKDFKIKQIVGRNIISSCYSRGDILFVLDNTRNKLDITSFCGYQIMNILDGGVNLCIDLFNVKDLAGIARIRSLLADVGFDSIRSMKVINYLSFVQETEQCLGNTKPLTIDVLEEYSGTKLVEWKLNQLLEAGEINIDNYEYLLGKYSEISSAATDFEQFLMLFAPFIGGCSPSCKIAVYIPVGEFDIDKAMQQMMCKLMLVNVQQNPEKSAVLIRDSGKGDRSFIVDIVTQLPTYTEVYMFSDDIFSLCDSDIGNLMNSFPVRIYTRHEDMVSCEKIEARCGQIDVIQKSSTVTIDKRFRANSVWDILLGNNRTETEIKNVPTKEYRFRKEMVNSLRTGYGIIDCAGEKVLFSF